MNHYTIKRYLGSFEWADSMLGWLFLGSQRWSRLTSNYGGALPVESIKRMVKMKEAAQPFSNFLQAFLLRQEKAAQYIRLMIFDLPKETEFPRVGNHSVIWWRRWQPPKLARSGCKKKPIHRVVMITPGNTPQLPAEIFEKILLNLDQQSLN